MHTPVVWIRKTGARCPSAPAYRLQLEENVTHLRMSSDIPHNTAVTFPRPLKDTVTTMQVAMCQRRAEAAELDVALQGVPQATTE
ncbi:hypothetical protein Q7C36_015780 [Tachysurus vachellii]|uniref:Uncharacterized protein n=1 Tax=Tachysurus vachellii TaxID=175792 RepID=A0AA88M912_TACVA|nr:hypothetical protein Q7C36_015780 [Tachysurus vachellii]